MISYIIAPIDVIVTLDAQAGTLAACLQVSKNISCVQEEAAMPETGYEARVTLNNQYQLGILATIRMRWA
jgi:hypothetical protein